MLNGWINLLVVTCETDKKIEAVNDAILTCGAFLSF
jgi:hypothetical protein